MDGDTDHCAVCAEVLRWTAIGPCGHKEACHSCIARLRLVCKDTRCVICKQECEAVFVTRAAGSFTAAPPASAFADLPQRAARRELFVDTALSMYFDDDDALREVAALTALSCRLCVASSSAKPPFSDLPQLQAHLRKAHGQGMCEICLLGRNVFISQQILYSKARRSAAAARRRPPSHPHLSSPDRAGEAPV
jgi:E3 ubiquitin-protein ligase ZNF598